MDDVTWEQMATKLFDSTQTGYADEIDLVGFVETSRTDLTPLQVCGEFSDEWPDWWTHG